MATPRVVLLALTLAAATASPGRTDEEPKVNLRGPAPQVGQVFRKTGKFQMKDADLTSQSQGTEVSGKVSLTVVSEEEVKIVAVDAGKVSRFQTKDIQDETRTVTTIAGHSSTDEDVDDLAGQVIRSEKREGKWTHALVDARPTEKQQKSLGRLAGWDDEEEIPEGKQPIGRSWEQDATHMKKGLGGGFTSVSGKVKATFVRLEKYRGELCAVIESAGRIKAKMAVDEGDGLMDLDLKAAEYRSLRSGYVMKTTLEGTARIVSKTKVGEVNVTVEMKGKFSAEETAELKE